MKLCKHCRYSHYGHGKDREGLVCVHPRSGVVWCEEACEEWERAPGSDDEDMTEPRA